MLFCIKCACSVFIIKHSESATRLCVCATRRSQMRNLIRTVVCGGQPCHIMCWMTFVDTDGLIPCVSMWYGCMLLARDGACYFTLTIIISVQLVIMQVCFCFYVGKYLHNSKNIFIFLYTYIFIPIKYIFDFLSYLGSGVVSDTCMFIMAKRTF